MIILSLLDWN